MNSNRKLLWPIVANVLLALFVTQTASADIFVNIEDVNINALSVPGTFDLDIFATVTPDSVGPAEGWSGLNLPFRVVPQANSSGTATFNSTVATDLAFFDISVDTSQSATGDYFLSGFALTLIDPPVNTQFTIATLSFGLGAGASGDFLVEPVFPAVDGPAIFGDAGELATSFEGGSISVVPEPSGICGLVLIALGVTYVRRPVRQN